MKRVLVDTSAIYALMARRDRNHQRARAFLSAAIGAGTRFVLADVVFAETMTLIRAHHGAAMAIRIGRDLRSSALYQWQALGAEDERATWAIFQQYDDKAWSYTDCALLALGRRLGLPEVFAFDAHFDQMPGMAALPR